MSSCEGTCAVITRHDAEPEWVCPGQDFSPKNHFRIENFDEDGDPSSKGVTLWGLWETSKGKHGQPGSVPLTAKVGTLSPSSSGVIETPPSGVHAVAGPQAAGYQFTLVASNTDCPSEGEKYLRDNQARIEETFGVTLEDAIIRRGPTAIRRAAAARPRRAAGADLRVAHGTTGLSRSRGGGPSSYGAARAGGARLRSTSAMTSPAARVSGARNAGPRTAVRRPARRRARGTLARCPRPGGHRRKRGARRQRCVKRPRPDPLVSCTSPRRRCRSPRS